LGEINNMKTKIPYVVYAVPAIAILIYMRHLEEVTIGHNYHRTLFIFLLPTLIGVVLLGYYRKLFVKNKILATKGVFAKIFVMLFYLLQGFLGSYLSLGIGTGLTWHYFNRKKAEQAVNEIFYCKITGFNRGTVRSGSNIWFLFQGHNENIKVDYQLIKKYLDASPKNYELEITAQRGIWNYYVLNDWTIITTR
jgi:hypothetical protein